MASLGAPKFSAAFIANCIASLALGIAILAWVDSRRSLRHTLELFTAEKREEALRLSKTFRQEAQELAKDLDRLAESAEYKIDSQMGASIESARTRSKELMKRSNDLSRDLEDDSVLAEQNPTKWLRLIRRFNESNDEIARTRKTAEEARKEFASRKPGAPDQSFKIAVPSSPPSVEK